MITDIAQRLVRPALWLTLPSACIGFTGIVLLSSYLGAKNGYELLGYQHRQASSHELIGEVAPTFVSKATIATYALCPTSRAGP